MAYSWISDDYTDTAVCEWLQAIRAQRMASLSSTHVPRHRL